MPETPETLAAILAEMRKAVVPMICGRPKIEAVSIRDVLQWADRIEAAAERERIELREDEAKMLLREYAAAPDESLTPSALELKRELLRLAPAPGNAAAMRDALEEISARIKQEIEQPIPGNDPTGGIAMCEMEVIANVALAAPARNCDRFRTLDDFSMADSPIDTPLTNATREQLYKVIRWLFAPAKGGAE
jgi:hypothetical protein